MRQFDFVCDLSAPVEEVFALISDHAALPRWAAEVRRVEVDVAGALVPGGAGTVRTLHPWIGPAGRETVIAVSAPHLLIYSADDRSLRGLYRAHRAELSCVAIAGGTRLRWRVDAQPSRSPMMRAVARAVVGFVLRRSLRNLQRRFGRLPRSG